MAALSRRQRRTSVSSESSSASSPERDPIYDDGDSLMEHANDSQSSLGVSLQEMELDAADFEERCRLSPISRLPPEILIAIFSKLNSPADVKTCMLVSRVWARNSVDILWHRPATGDWRKLLNVIGSARKKDSFFPYHELIKRLNLSALGDAVSDGVLQPIAGCKRIERLTLTNCTKLTDASVEALITDNRSLLALDVSGLDLITDRSLFAVAQCCVKLQGLNITNCKRVTDNSLIMIAQQCRRVKRLKFNGCSQITDRAVVSFADKCRDILEIDLQGCENLTDFSITALIEKGSQLRELRLAYCSRITDEAFLALPMEVHYDCLRILDLTDCNELNDAGLQKIVSVAPRLRNIVLAKCRNITDRGVLAITKLGKNLHYIHLGHCTRITDHGLGQLVKHCNRIRYIDLACCQNLTDESVVHLAALPKLKRIGLVKCSNITNLSIKELARPKPLGSNGGFYPNNLERLHLSYCVNLTIEGVRIMLINCPRLTHLSLTGINEFLRADIFEYCRDPPPEFNDHQREVFCVFSGRGVQQLREYLRDSYPSPPGSDAGLESDTDTLTSHPTSTSGPLLFPPPLGTMQHPLAPQHPNFYTPTTHPPHNPQTQLQQLPHHLNVHNQLLIHSQQGYQAALQQQQQLAMQIQHQNLTPYQQQQHFAQQQLALQQFAPHPTIHQFLAPNIQQHNQNPNTNTNTPLQNIATRAPAFLNALPQRQARRAPPTGRTDPNGIDAEEAAFSRTPHPLPRGREGEGSGGGGDELDDESFEEDYGGDESSGSGRLGGGVGPSAGWASARRSSN